MLAFHNQEVINDSTSNFDGFISKLMFTQSIRSKVLLGCINRVNKIIERYSNKKTDFANCNAFYNSVSLQLSYIQNEELINFIGAENEADRKEVQDAIEELLACIHTGMEGPKEMNEDNWMEFAKSINEPLHPYQGLKDDGTIEGYIKAYFDTLSKMSVVRFYNSGYYKNLFCRALNKFNTEYPEAYTLFRGNNVANWRVTNYLTTQVLDAFCKVMKGGSVYSPDVHSNGIAPQNYERITSWDEILNGKKITVADIFGVYGEEYSSVKMTLNGEEINAKEESQV